MSARGSGLQSEMAAVPGKAPQYPTQGEVSVLDCGAVGDGETDDSSAIQALLYTLADDQTVVFPAGHRYLAQHLTLPNTALVLTGPVEGDESRAKEKSIKSALPHAPVLVLKAGGRFILSSYPEPEPETEPEPDPEPRLGGAVKKTTVMRRANEPLKMSRIQHIMLQGPMLPAEKLGRVSSRVKPKPQPAAIESEGAPSPHPDSVLVSQEEQEARASMKAWQQNGGGHTTTPGKMPNDSQVTSGVGIIIATPTLDICPSVSFDKLGLTISAPLPKLVDTETREGQGMKDDMKT